MQRDIVDLIKCKQITSIDQIDIRQLWSEWREYFYSREYAFKQLREQWKYAKQFNDVTYLDV